jgi:hypothetical protein
VAIINSSVLKGDPIMPPIRPELLDELLKDYKKPDDLLGQDGLLQQLIKAFVEKLCPQSQNRYLILSSANIPPPTS